MFRLHKMYSSLISLVLVMLPLGLTAPTAPRACTGPNVNSATISLIKEFEGFVAYPDPDPVGYPTVGYGHKCTTSGCSEVPYSFPLTESTATQLLLSDVKSPQQAITLYTASSVVLNANEYGALVSWAYNIGNGAAKSSTLISRLNAGEDELTVIQQELPKWNKAGGSVLPGLTRRRAAEVSLAQTGTSAGALPAC